MTAAPASLALASEVIGSPLGNRLVGSRLMNRSLKLTPPMILPMGGMRMSLTMEVTILPKAPPIITPTARSTTLPFRANSLNSFNMLMVFRWVEFSACPIFVLPEVLDAPGPARTFIGMPDPPEFGKQAAFDRFARPADSPAKAAQKTYRK